MTTLRETVFPETAPIPIITERGRKDVRATFAIRSYRWIFLAMLSTSLGAWVSRIAIDWMILEMTGSLVAVGFAVTCQCAPVLLLGLWGGALSDRFPRLRVMRIANGTAATGVLALAVLAQFDALALWHIYLAAAVAGLASVAEAPARAALIAQSVPPERLQTAIGMNAASFQSASLVGIATSGSMIALFGAPWALTIAAVFSMGSFVALTRLRTAEIPVLVRSAQWGTGVGAAVRYAWRKPTIRWPLVLLIFLATFGMTYNVLLAAAAREVGFGTGAAGYSLYMAAAAFGAILGAIASTRRRTTSLAGLVCASFVFGMAMLGTAAMPSSALFAVAVLVMSFTRVIYGTTAEALVQLTSNPAVRGRISGFYFVIAAAGQTGGAVLVGAIAQTWGVHAAFTIAGGVLLVASLAVTALSARSWGIRLSLDLHSFRRPVRIARLETARASTPTARR